MNAWDVMRDAFREARLVESAADEQVDLMAEMLRGRLRKCNTDRLAALKRELRDFNMHTGQWKP